MQALFVHGMGRTPISGWPLLRKLRTAGVDGSTFGYSTTTCDFSQISSNLARRIAKLASHGEYILIGHSLGGLLLRAALMSLPKNTRPPIRVFLLGSPIRSARLARLLQHNPIYRMVTQDCGKLLASDERMKSVGPLMAPTTGIFGVRGVRATFKVFHDEPNDGIVAVSETSAPWIMDKISVPVIHTFLPTSNIVATIIMERLGKNAQV
jgi:pimeloyl-ACP methyl ester carboxylesterase